MTCETSLRALEEVRDRDRVFVVLAKPQRQRLETLQKLEGVERRDRRAEVAQQLDARAQRIGDRSERLRSLRPDGAVIGFVRLREQGEALGVLLPREIAAIDDEAADRGAVSADVFRRGIDDDRRAMLEGTRDQRRRRVVGDQRHAERAADVGDFADREDVAASDWEGSPRNRRASLRRSRGGTPRDRSDRRSGSRCRTASASARTASRCRRRGRSRRRCCRRPGRGSAPNRRRPSGPRRRREPQRRLRARRCAVSSASQVGF